jgi:hypothetical protein
VSAIIKLKAAWAGKGQRVRSMSVLRSIEGQPGVGSTDRPRYCADKSFPKALLTFPP